MKMKMTLPLFLAFLFFGFTSAFGQVENVKFQTMLKTLLSHTVKEINVQEAAEKKGVIFLDAREKKEFKVSHIEGAKWVGYDTFSKKNLKGISTDKEIVVYCSVGYRSEKISEKLKKMGYKNVSNLYGGIFEWVNQNKKVVKNAAEKTKEVHAYDKNWGKWLLKGEKIYK